MRSIAIILVIAFGIAVMLWCCLRVNAIAEEDADEILEEWRKERRNAERDTTL